MSVIVGIIGTKLEEGTLWNNQPQQGGRGGCRDLLHIVTF